MNTPRRRSLSRKFNVSLIGAGVLITLLTLALNLSLHHRKNVENQFSKIDDAAHTRLTQLARALGDRDSPAIRQALDAFTQIPGVSWLELATPAGLTQIRGQTNQVDTQHDRPLTLAIPPQNNHTALGTITLHIQSPPAWLDDRHEVLTTAGFQLLLLVILLALGNLLLRRTVLSPIRQQTQSLLDLHPDSPSESALPAEIHHSQDELDQLTTAILQARQRLARQRRKNCL